MKSIYDLSWDESSFLANLQLFFASRKQEQENIRSSDRLVRAQGYSVLSRTYCSIVGSAFAQLKLSLRSRWFAPVRIASWCCAWLPLAAYCYWRMLPLSNRVVAFVGYDGMSPDQCDVRQSILRHRGKYDEAKQCICVALAKNPEAAHTRGLLHVGLAEIYRRDDDRDNADVEVRLALVDAAASEWRNPRQAVRIYRRCADVVDFVKRGHLLSGRDLRRKAQLLAKGVGIRDQLL